MAINKKAGSNKKRKKKSRLGRSQNNGEGKKKNRKKLEIREMDWSYRRGDAVGGEGDKRHHQWQRRGEGAETTRRNDWGKTIRLQKTDNGNPQRR